MNNKYLSHLLFICISCFIALSCSPKLTNPLQFAGDKITFGEGGGFAGIENQYVILDNGELFQKRNQDGSFVQLEGANRDRIIQVFETYEMLNFAALEIENPGNLYYFIEYQALEGTSHRMVWGNGQVDQNVELVYRILSKEVRESIK